LEVIIEPTEPAAAKNEVVEEVAPVAAAVQESSVAKDSAVEAPARKRIERAKDAWAEEAGGGQLSIVEGEFIKTWTESRTDIGWIYVEKMDSSAVGWIPTFALDPSLPASKRWMEVIKSMKASHSSQLDVTEGMVLQIHAATRTKEGWAYAETPGGAAGVEKQVGWAPVMCLEWAEE